MEKKITISDYPLLSVQNLQLDYAGPFSFDLAQGECIAILGTSGSGKSVLLRMIADLEPNSGDVFLNGMSRSSWSAPEWRHQVIYQAAEPAWWESTAGKHFSIKDQNTVLELLSRLNLSRELLEVDINRLSTGERQRLALVRSLVNQPKILLLDEPTSALDQASIQAVEALLSEELHKGLGIVLVTHSTELAKRLSHRILRIEQGGFVSL
ncbi:ABC transporter ATP-binding protein [Acinetobacter brisouii]|uniref:ABC transporter ATP-binding protein n=1 Tax=Acinetobacter brisouii TaxID=396323 RepID=UPI000ADA077E|nr:ATP-binding cassette domain-containing protein [Acinetobacter brisouii]